MSKSADAFRTISEVADWLGVQAHVLRFWESKFTQIKPVKRAGGRRYYRPADMQLLGGIRKLLHKDGLSIKEVQAILRDHGIPHVSQLSHDLEADGPPPETEIPLPGRASASKAPPADQANQVASPEPSHAEEPEVQDARPAEAEAVSPRPPGLSVKSAESPKESPHKPEPSADVVQEIELAPTASERTEDVLEPQQPDAAVLSEVAPGQAELSSSDPGLESTEPEQMHMLLDSPGPVQSETEELNSVLADLPDPALSSPIETTAVVDVEHTPEAETAPEIETLAPPVETTSAVPTPEPAENSEELAISPDSTEEIVEPAPIAQPEPAPATIEENHFAADESITSPPTDLLETGPADEEPVFLADPASGVLSLLEQTSTLPAHLVADAAQCAAELRAILAGRQNIH